MHPAFRALALGLLFGAPFAATAGAAQPSCSLNVVELDDTSMRLRYDSPDGVVRTVWVHGQPYTLTPGQSVVTPSAATFDWPEIGHTYSSADVHRICNPGTTTTTTSSTTTTSTTVPPSTTTTAVSPTTVTAPTTVVTATTPQPSTSLPPATSTSVELLPPVTVPGVPTTVGASRLPETGRNTSSALLLGGVLAVSGAAALVAQRMVDREND